jgi:hypothetical protein
MFLCRLFNRLWGAALRVFAGIYLQNFVRTLEIMKAKRARKDNLLTDTFSAGPGASTG